MALIAGSAYLVPGAKPEYAGVSGTGLALALAQARISVPSIQQSLAASIAQLTATGTVYPGGPPAANPAATAWWPGFVQTVADQATADAAAIVSYFQANATAVVTTSDVLGRVPSSTTSGTPIEPPAATVLLSIQ